MRKYTMDQTCTYCLKEMFRRVGEKYPNPELTRHDNWYQMRCWTEKEMESFVKWMVRLLRKRHGLSAKSAELEARMFDVTWGWTTNKEVMDRALAGATIMQGGSEEP